MRLARDNQALQKKVGEATKAEPVGESTALKKVRTVADQVAPTDSTVLLMGESGTGKELFARYIHLKSKRSRGPFVAINCGALPEQLLESELFGHSRGAFTGAVSEHRGLFQGADRGTLFLHEIGDMPLPLQVKLLRALQERQILLRATHQQRCQLVADAGTEMRRLAVVDGKAGPLRLDQQARPILHALQHVGFEAGNIGLGPRAQDRLAQP